MLNRKLTGALLLTALLALALTLQGMGCSSSSGTTTGDGGSDAMQTSDTTVPTSDGGHDATSEAATKCTGGQMPCNGACVTLSSSPTNCGACGVTCPSGFVCAPSGDGGGVCAVNCGDGGGLTQCGMGCADLQMDFDNCGMCNHPCMAGQACTNGTCGTVCAGGSTNCSGVCVDTLNDEANCGTCGTACAAGTVCSMGTCSVNCMSDMNKCPADGGIVCSDPLSDPANCGSCGHPCGGLTPVCAKGVCSSGCGTSSIDCNGSCIDPQSDNTFCGASGACGQGDAGSAGTPCQVSAGFACVAGKCTLTCTQGQINCGGVCVDPTNSSTHCGATAGCGTGGGTAGTDCTTTNEFCVNGGCEVSCAPLLQCATDGCINPQTDLKHCGATGDCSGANGGTQCPPGDVCSGGLCQPNCGPGQVACGGRCVDPASSNEFCGATGNCEGSNSGQTCTTGEVCTVLTGQTTPTCQLSCQPGFVDCGNLCIDPTVSNTNCGAAPTIGGVGGQCTAGAPMGDPNYPGVQCPSGMVCAGGVCATQCLAGEALCGLPGDQKCVNPQTDNGFCGAENDGDAGTCNNAVNCSAIGGEQCVSGHCQCLTGQIVCMSLSGAVQCIDPSSSNEFCGATTNATLNAADGGVITNCGGYPTPAVQGNCLQNVAGSSCLSGTCTCPASPSNSATTEFACVVGGSGPPGTPTGGTLTCVDQLANNSFCGATASGSTGSPGVQCPGATNCLGSTGGSTCQGGSCVCPSGQIGCPSSGATPSQCINPTTSNTNCGASGNCTNSGANSAGDNCTTHPLTQCTTVLGEGTACTSTCGSEQQCVPDAGAAYCANTTSDNNNCGSCFTSCGALGVCGLDGGVGACSSSCPSSQIQCPAGVAPNNPTVPYCANLQTDTNNCGTCGNVCEGGVCSGSACTGSCSGSSTQCVPDAGTPYCADTQTDVNNCGGCFQACGSGQTCIGGLCCTGGSTQLCTGDDGGPSCIDTNTDPNNCGTCGHACGAGQSNCAGGMCTSARYATATLPGATKETVFLFVAGGTTLSGDSDYANACTAAGFAQNQDNDTGRFAPACSSWFNSAGNFSSTNYYCADCCCYMGVDGEAQKLSNFQNFGLPLSTALPVIDRGCGDYQNGSFTSAVNTNDALTVTGASSFTYSASNSPNRGGTKTVSIGSSGAVIICETP